MTKSWQVKSLRFGISGMVVTGIHVVIATLAIEIIAFKPAIANGIAFLSATLCSYLINTLWSFSAKLQRQNLMRFLSVALAGLATSMGISGVADYFGLPYFYGIVLVICIIPPMSFLLHNFWTYQ